MDGDIGIKELLSQLQVRRRKQQEILDELDDQIKTLQRCMSIILGPEAVNANLSGKPIVRFDCPHCKAQFKGQGWLNRHIREEHKPVIRVETGEEKGPHGSEFM